MKQRVKLAQALVHDPRLVLLDEPTNGLDPSGRDDMLALVQKVGHEFGIAVLVTSHLLGELERVSDHVVVLDGGKLLQSSATTEFLHATGSLIVEVMGKPDADRLLGQALVEAGLTARPAGGALIEVEVRDEATPDVVRDLTVDLGLGLVRMQERHHRIEDVFREGGAGSGPARLTPPPSTAVPSGVIHDLGYRPYAGPRLGAGPVAWSFFRTGLRNTYGLGRCGRSKVVPMILLAMMLLPALILVGVLRSRPRTCSTSTSSSWPTPATRSSRRP